jgi:hypothetical protein
MPAFATLTPANAAAKLGFSTLVERGLVQADEVPYCARFYHVNPGQSSYLNVGLLFDLPKNANSSDSGSIKEGYECTENKRISDSTIWTGHFIFDFEVVTEANTQAWHLGTGSSKANDDVEFLVPFPPRAKHQIKSGLGHKDVKFFLHPETGHVAVLQLSNKSGGLSVNGQPVGQTSHTFDTNVPTRIEIGPCVFDFAYTTAT